jgi:hypothetical protein
LKIENSEFKIQIQNSKFRIQRSCTARTTSNTHRNAGHRNDTHVKIDGNGSVIVARWLGGALSGHKGEVYDVAVNNTDTSLRIANILASIFPAQDAGRKSSVRMPHCGSPCHTHERMVRME